MDRFNFLGLNYHNITFAQALDRLESFIKARTPSKVYTTGAELIVRASKNSRLREIYNSADLLLIDSFIPFYAARLLRNPVKEPVNAARLMTSFFKIIHLKGYGVYLLGATEESLNRAVYKLKEKYPGINIVGWHHGYFDFNNDCQIVNDIREKKPDILFVAMSSPLKEDFIARNADKSGIPVLMGVGGSIDVISGRCRLAPMWISKIGLEWFYRFIQEPARLWKRYVTTNSMFIWLLIKELLGNEKTYTC